MRSTALPDGHRWLRVSKPEWADPFDTSYAERHGGRWNPPGSWPTLYLNDDLATARLQIHRMLDGTPVDPDDLSDDAFDVAVATLPRRRNAADIRTPDGIAEVGLPASFPVDEHGSRIPHEDCWPIATTAFDIGLDGVDCRSAATLDGNGRELAWWPRGRKVRPGRRALYGAWRHADVDTL